MSTDMSNEIRIETTSPDYSDNTVAYLTLSLARANRALDQAREVASITSGRYLDPQADAYVTACRQAVEGWQESLRSYKGR